MRRCVPLVTRCGAQPVVTRRLFSDNKNTGSDNSKQDATQRTASFGFRDVPAAEKESLVGDVFRKVADGYDRMNDTMRCATTTASVHWRVLLSRDRHAAVWAFIVHGRTNLYACLAPHQVRSWGVIASRLAYSTQDRVCSISLVAREIYRSALLRL